jgi:alanyl-tRNA synthetase
MKNDYKSFVDIFEKKYKNIYPRISENKDNIIHEMQKEYDKFIKTLSAGLKEFEKAFLSLGEVTIGESNDNMSGEIAFNLYSTYGFPIELTLELAKEKNIEVDLEDFNKKMAEHQKLSQTASAGMFKGGLANHNEKTIKLHTTHHLLLAGLQSIVNKNIKQKGSNITEERLRMDFICDHKLTDEEKKKVEDFVNDKIKQGLDVVRREMPLKEAEKIGAEMEFGAKYPDVVSVYFIEDKDGNQISKEFCGGPHVQNTSVLGSFKIQKEEAVSAGIRRIKAILL